MSTPYGKQAVTPGQVTIYNVSANIGYAVVQNESPYTLLVQIDGTGSGKNIPAQCMDKIVIPAQGFNGNIILTPIVILSNANNAPSYEVVLDAYGVDEDPGANYPVALSRAVQVGGIVATNGTIASSVANNGNGVPTDVLTATAANGDLTARITNGGLLHLGSANFGALLDLIFSPNAIGPAAGTGICNVYQLFSGTVKMTLFQCTNWKNTGSPFFTGIAPNNEVFNGPGLFFYGDMPGFSILNNAQAAMTVEFTSGGTGTSGTAVNNQFGYGSFNTNGATYLQFSGGNATNHNGALLIIGA